VQNGAARLPVNRSRLVIEFLTSASPNCVPSRKSRTKDDDDWEE